MFRLFRDNIARNKHFLAPEWGTTSEATLNTAIDIYAFGMCALETAALELLPANPSASAATSGGSGSNGAGGADASANGHHHQNGSTNGNPDNEGSTLVTEESIQRTIGKNQGFFKGSCVKMIYFETISISQKFEEIKSGDASFVFSCFTAFI